MKSLQCSMGTESGDDVEFNRKWQKKILPLSVIETSKADDSFVEIMR